MPSIGTVGTNGFANRDVVLNLEDLASHMVRAECVWHAKKGNYYIHGNKIKETLVGDLDKIEKCIERPPPPPEKILLMVDLSLDNVGQKKPDP